MRDNTFSGWACTDCLFLLANGETPDGLDEAGTAAYLASVARQTEGTEVTLGMFREDHGCASNFTVTYHVRSEVRGTFRHGELEIRADDNRDAYDRAGLEIPAGAWIVRVAGHELETESDRGGECECECEQLTFSSSACDVCGSYLARTRDAVVFWLQPEPATVTQ